MRIRCFLLSLFSSLLLMLSIASAFAQDTPYLTVTGPSDEQLKEGNTYQIGWNSEGLKTVTVTAEGKLTDYPGGGRDSFSLVISNSVPAGNGGVSWTVPFLDTVEFAIIVKGYDENGIPATRQEVRYLFRPDILRDRTTDGIYVDLRDENRQRLYVLRNNRVMKAYLTSGAYSKDFYPRNIHPKKPHDHYGVFRVQGKYRNWYSRLFQVNMPWAMNYWGGHFIHATSPQYYEYLGTAASHGCDRLQLQDAKELYDMTPVGTRVEIIVK